MKKKLPLSMNPLISCFNDESFKYNIVSQNKSFEDWLYSSYMHLCVENERGNLFGYLKGYHGWPYVIPGLEENSIKRIFFESIMKKYCIIELITNSLIDDYYCYVFLDEFYVNNRYSYKERHFTHDNLIYGVDSDIQCFLIYGYGVSGKLEKSKISFNSFEKAFKKLSPEHEENSDIIFLKPKECEYTFELQKYKQSIKSYLSGEILNRELATSKFGTDVYSTLVSYFSLDYSFFDPIRMHKLLEHKIWLKKSLEYLTIEKNMEFLITSIGEVDELVRRAKLIKGLTMKYNIIFENTHKKSIDIKQRIVVQLYELKEIEIKFLEDLLFIL